jgi:hypothetical protein
VPTIEELMTGQCQQNIANDHRKQRARIQNDRESIERASGNIKDRDRPHSGQHPGHCFSCG